MEGFNWGPWASDLLLLTAGVVGFCYLRAKFGEKLEAEGCDRVLADIVLVERIQKLEEQDDPDEIPDMAKVLEGYKKSEGAIPLDKLLKVASKAVEIALEQVSPGSANDSLRSRLRGAAGDLNDAAEILTEKAYPTIDPEDFM